jgi:hypothetical protein
MFLLISVKLHEDMHEPVFVSATTASPPDVRQGSALPATYFSRAGYARGSGLTPKLRGKARSDGKAEPCLTSGGEAGNDQSKAAKRESSAEITFVRLRMRLRTSRHNTRKQGQPTCKD